MPHRYKYGQYHEFIGRFHINGDYRILIYRFSWDVLACLPLSFLKSQQLLRRRARHTGLLKRFSHFDCISGQYRNDTLHCNTSDFSLVPSRIRAYIYIMDLIRLPVSWYSCSLPSPPRWWAEAQWVIWDESISRMPHAYFVTYAWAWRLMSSQCCKLYTRERLAWTHTGSNASLKEDAFNFKKAATALAFLLSTPLHAFHYSAATTASKRILWPVKLPSHSLRSDMSMLLPLLFSIPVYGDAWHSFLYYRQQLSGRRRRWYTSRQETYYYFYIDIRLLDYMRYFDSDSHASLKRKVSTYLCRAVNILYMARYERSEDFRVDVILSRCRYSEINTSMPSFFSQMRYLANSRPAKAFSPARNSSLILNTASATITIRSCSLRISLLCSRG